MKKLILGVVIFFIVAFIAWAIWFFILSKDRGAPAGQNAQELRTVTATTPSGVSVQVANVPSPQDPDVAKDFLRQIKNSDQTALGGTVIASPYAVQIWGDQNGGGEALLEHATSTGWNVISFGGGEWSALGLIQQGVSVETAQKIIIGLKVMPLPSTPPIDIPMGDTIIIGTPNGGVSMRNFYNGAIYIDHSQRAVVILQTIAYGIIYNLWNSSFNLVVSGMPLADARKTAEAAFLDTLGISRTDACKLTTYENFPKFGTASYESRLSFCGPKQ